MIPSKMTAAVLIGHGGLEKLEVRNDVPVPQPKAGELLIEVGATCVNNTDINTRIGWYSKKVDAETGTGAAVGIASIDDDDASWSGTSLKFPLIQGGDVCGRVVAVGAEVPSDRIGERVIVRPLLRSYVDYRPFEGWVLGSECNGGFAQFVVAPARETYAVNCDWSDEELAAVPCAYSTAENMLDRAAVGRERVLVTGASGGVGLAAVQLAKRRGATVIGICAPNKAAEVRAQGADQTFERNSDLVAALGSEAVDVVIDLVGGPQLRQLLELLRRGGRCAVAGAIGGPIVEIDIRTVYLKDLTLFGCTFLGDQVFENLVRYIESGQFRPVIAHVYPLNEIVLAQKDFLSKAHTGKLVLVPPRR
ncbi:alcohol dehydrogenase family protein [Mesorhizobium sp. M1312]|uniref:alcohol dehydrogenase family protein n=1 Tax=unclassified Mesorhizobium TaxID=325217 RepID=UPI00333C9EBB